MKRFKAHLLFIGILATSFCMAQKPKSDAESGELKGKVKSLKTTTMTTQARADGTLKMMTEITTDYFNENGNIILSMIRHGNQKLDDTLYTVKYYGNNRKEVVSYSKVGYRCEKDIWFFDSKDFVYKIIHCFSNPIEWREDVINLFDNRGFIIKKILKYSYRNDSIVAYYKYDDYGNKIEETDEEIKMKSHYKYDKKGNCIEKFVEVLGDGDNWFKYVWDYDDYNNPIKFKAYTNNRKECEITTSEYKYDSQKNYIKILERSNTRPTIETVRVIEYY